jgi:hypothetical protein
MAVFYKCVRMQLRCIRTQKCTASLPGARARTQMRDGRSQLRERPGIGGCRIESTGNGVFAYEINIAIKLTLL